MRSITIFYAWQSDTNPDCNQRAIRKALLEVIPILEETHFKVKFELEEATSNMPGSEYIPGAIVRKIYKSDIFIGDISTVNPESANRKMPNPNVVIELGHAVAVLGWSRIILLVNSSFSKVPDDVPFDVDRHRISQYKKETKDDKSGQGALKTLLQKAIDQIVKADPNKPDWSKKMRSQSKHAHDVKILRQLFSIFHIPSFEVFLTNAPETLDTRILYFSSGFIEMIKLSSFYLYDKKAYKYCKRMAKEWQASLRFADNYRGTKQDHIVRYGSTHWPFERDPDKRAEQQEAFERLKERERKQFDKLLDTVNDLKQTFKEFYHFLKTNYSEIDLAETSAEAWQRFQKEES